MRCATLCSEKTKLFSYGWCLLGIAGAILIPSVVLLLSDTAIGKTENELVGSILKMLYLGQAGVVVIGAAYWGQEYSNTTLRATLLAVPARLKLVFAKTIVLSIVVIITCIISSILCLFISYIKSEFGLTISLVKNLMENTMFVTCSWLPLAWISASLSILTKSITVPVAILLSLILGLGQMLFSVIKWMKYTPVLATMNLFLPTSNAFLDQSSGLFIQFLWGVLFTIIAALSFSYRDVR